MLPEEDDTQWSKIAARWVAICEREGLVRGSKGYADRANEFFQQLYMESRAPIVTSKTNEGEHD